jgi:hypothetical protein
MCACKEILNGVRENVKVGERKSREESVHQHKGGTHGRDVRMSSVVEVEIAQTAETAVQLETEQQK